MWPVDITGGHLRKQSTNFVVFLFSDFLKRFLHGRFQIQVCQYMHKTNVH